MVAIGHSRREWGGSAWLRPWKTQGCTVPGCDVGRSESILEGAQRTPDVVEMTQAPAGTVDMIEEMCRSAEHDERARVVPDWINAANSQQAANPNAGSGLDRIHSAHVRTKQNVERSGTCRQDAALGGSSSGGHNVNKHSSPDSCRAQLLMSTSIREDRGPDPVDRESA